MEKKHPWTEVNRRKEPFKVPDGYFENFTERMMASLPKVEEVNANQRKPKRGFRTWALRLSPVIGAAAMLVCAVVYQFTYHSLSRQVDMANTRVVDNKSNLTKAAADDVYDYLMLDNLKIYDYEMEEYE